MSVPVRLGAFALVLAATFGGGAALGAAFGPDDLSPPASHEQPHSNLAPTTTAPDAAAPTSSIGVTATTPTTSSAHGGSHP